MRSTVTVQFEASPRLAGQRSVRKIRPRGQVGEDSETRSPPMNYLVAVRFSLRACGQKRGCQRIPNLKKEAPPLTATPMENLKQLLALGLRNREPSRFDKRERRKNSNSQNQAARSTIGLAIQLDKSAQGHFEAKPSNARRLLSDYRPRRSPCLISQVRSQT